MKITIEITECKTIGQLHDEIADLIVRINRAAVKSNEGFYDLSKIPLNYNFSTENCYIKFEDD